MKNFIKKVRIYCKNLNKWPIIVALIALISLGVRIWFNAPTCFHIDQSRDAIVASKILAGDWQIFGPVVSGGGALFHGVLYYYVLAPLYFLGGGSPVFVNLSLAFLTVLGLFPTFLLARRILKKDSLAYIVVILTAFSACAVEFSGSFTNLVLGVPLLPLFFLYGLKCLEKFSWQNSLLWGIITGLLVQVGLSNLQWGLPVIVILGLILAQKGAKKAFWQSFLVYTASFLLIISSMILVEFLAWQRGLFALEGSMHWLTSEVSFGQKLAETVAFAAGQFNYFLWPGLNFAWLLIILLGLTIVVYYRQKLAKEHYLLLLFIFPPIIAKLFTNWGSYTFAGYEAIFYTLIVFVLDSCLEFLGVKLEGKVNKKLFLAISSGFLLIIFLIFNFTYLGKNYGAQENFHCIMQTNWQQKLAAIDYTYKQADGEDFTVDIVAEPYGINSTYGYLYQWYGQANYGYTPSFSGLPQAGLISEGTLVEKNWDQVKHFVITEPGTYNFWFTPRGGDRELSPEAWELFYSRQPDEESLREVKNFEQTRVEVYF